jgi:hypothetical protein
VTTIASTPKGQNVKPPPGPAEPLARTNPAELTDEQRGWLSAASRSNIDGWLHITIKGSPAARDFQYGFLVADEYAESIRVYREMTYQDIGMGYDFFVERAAELHADKIPDELGEEMEGVAAGLTAAGVPATFNDVLGINDWMELTGYWWPKNSGRYRRWRRLAARATTAARLSRPAARPSMGRSSWGTPASPTSGRASSRTSSWT